jgi:hypothetical protein
MRIVLLFVALVLSSSAQGQETDILQQLDGLWTAEWVATGNSKLEQVQFNRNAVNRHTAALPFFPGLATITLSDGSGGSDIKVSGTGFDCLYAYSTYNKDYFAWTYKAGGGGCVPSAKFLRVLPSRADDATIVKEAIVPSPVLNIMTGTWSEDEQCLGRQTSKWKVIQQTFIYFRWIHSRPSGEDEGETVERVIRTDDDKVETEVVEPTIDAGRKFTYRIAPDKIYITARSSGEIRTVWRCPWYYGQVPSPAFLNPLRN